MTKIAKKLKKVSLRSKIETLRKKAKRKRLKAKKRSRLASIRRYRLDPLKCDKQISEDECDFDFDNSGRALCSTSEDDSDGPQGCD